MIQNHCNDHYFTIRFDFGEEFDAGVDYGTRYNFSVACPRCGTAAVQMENLKVKSRELSDRFCMAMSWFGHFIVREDLFENLVGVGLDARDALAVNILGKSEFSWFQVLPRFSLPKMHVSSSGFQRSNHQFGISCPICDRDGYFNIGHVKEQFVFSRRTVADYLKEVSNNHIIKECDYPEVFFTWECFGKTIPGNVIPPKVLAYPKIVFKEKLMRVLKDRYQEVIDENPVLWVE
jgi:hypothetical protein